MNMNINELERIAYITGSPNAQTLAYLMDDLIDQETMDTLLINERDEYFERGKEEGLGIETAEVIEELEKTIATSSEQVVKLRDLLRISLESLQLPTVKARTEQEKKIKQSAQFIGVWL